MKEKEAIEGFIGQMESPFGFLMNVQNEIYDRDDDDDDEDTEPAKSKSAFEAAMKKNSTKPS